MHRSAATCVVCQRALATDGLHTEGDHSICALCRADAKQFFEIQDSIWGEVGDASRPIDEADKPALS